MTRKITIVDLNSSGEGVGRIDEKVCFVPGLLPGEEGLVEITEIKKRYSRARLVELIKKSPFRVSSYPAEDIGACPLINLAYEEQLLWKVSFTKNAFKKMAGLELDISDILPAKDLENYRSKLTLFFDKGRLGYRRAGSHELAPLDICRLGHRDFEPFYKLLENRQELTSVTLRRADTGIMVLLSGKEKSLETSFLDSLKAQGARSIYYKNEYRDKDYRLVRGEKTLAYTVMDRPFTLTPRSFFQVNEDQAAGLYKLVKGYLDPRGDEVLLDLYAGQGTIGAYLSDRVKGVIAIESLEEAVTYGSQSLPKNMKLLRGQVEKMELPLADIVVLDPPRAGLKPQVIEKLKSLAPKKIVYVSCDPVTQARDIALLGDDYELVRSALVDMFPNTAHVECIALIQKEII